MTPKRALKPNHESLLQLYLYSDFSSSYAYSRTSHTDGDAVGSLGGGGPGAGAAESENLEHLGPIIRNIHLSKQQDAFLRHLTKFTGEKEAEIEQVCRSNYQVCSFAHLRRLSRLTDARRRTSLARWTSSSRSDKAHSPCALM